MSVSGEHRAAAILVVEPDSLLRELVAVILKRSGFEVLAAGSAKDAILLEVGFPRPIQVLLSSITVPGTTGPAFAKAMKERRPEIRFMFMSGYPDGAMLILNYGWAFIAKPFVATELVAKVKTSCPAARATRARMVSIRGSSDSFSYLSKLTREDPVGLLKCLKSALSGNTGSFYFPCASIAFRTAVMPDAIRNRPGAAIRMPPNARIQSVVISSDG